MGSRILTIDQSDNNYDEDNGDYDDDNGDDGDDDYDDDDCHDRHHNHPD